MTDNRDPISCNECGTVNPWMNEKCRNCGADISLEARNKNAAVAAEVGPESRNHDEATAQKERKADQSLASPETESHPPVTAQSASPYKPRLNILWICVGIAAYIALTAVGEFMVAKWVIAPEPRLRAIIEKAQSGTHEISKDDKKELRSLLVGNRVFVALVFLLMVGAPFLVAATIGYFTRGIWEGAVAMGLAVFILCLLAGEIAVGLLAGAIYVGIGSVGAIAGNFFRQKQQQGRR